MFRSLLIWVALLTCSCSEQTNESEQSLVGAKRLPTTSVLATETLTIRDNTNDAHAYEYELTPADALLITRYDRDANGFVQKITNKQISQVPSYDAAIARNLLRRLRPEELEGMGVIVPPEGCKRQQLHANGDYVVAFTSAGTGKGSQGGRIGIFQSGYAKTCDNLACCTTPAAVTAHKVVRQAIQQLVKGTK